MKTLLDPAMLLLFAVMGATIWFAVATRRGVSVPVRIARGTMFFGGALIASLGAAHTVAVTGRAIFRRGPTFEYDFRLYALVLLGVLLITGGVGCVAAAWKLAQADPRAWKTALTRATLLLALSLPLIPIQGFAGAVALLMVINLLVLLATGRHLVATPDARTPTRSGLAREPLPSAN